VLCLYYGFLLLTTALSHGLPYPLFGAVLTGPVATVALAVDCLLLIHIVVGVARAQRLTWYLLLGYNAVNLLSLLVTLAVLPAGELSSLLGGADPSPAFYAGVGLAVIALLVATAYAVRARARFHNPSPYLF
jgi:hypothetical protein